VQIAVTDNGTGMTDAVEPFFTTKQPGVPASAATISLRKHVDRLVPKQ
jgi:hypothetical protein